MPACLTCGYENLVTATVCVHCHRSLIENGDDVIPRRPTLLETISKSSARTAVQNIRAPRPDAIVLYIENIAEPIIVDGAKQVILGRCTPDITAQIGVDLEPFSGAERGVSRTHAAIRCTNYGLEIEDLASTNGTWLNDDKLAAFMPRPLRSGDHVRLGLLEISVYLRGQTQAAGNGRSEEPDRRRPNS
jgi:pSer/pThr/pTyr-binding forkhead associated (FHA) protein